MKKYLFTALILLIGFIPFYVSAKDGKPIKQTLNEALTAEGITAKDSNYSGENNKVKVYIFRGQGCPHCKDLLSYMNSIISKYGDIIDINVYEVWYDVDNSALMQSVANTMRDTIGGVPYMIIGDKSFKGYSTGSNSSITKQIDKMNKTDNPYDVMEHIGEVKTTTGNSNAGTTNSNNNNTAQTGNGYATAKGEEHTTNVGEIIAWIVGVGLTLAGIVYIIMSKYKMKNAK